MHIPITEKAHHCWDMKQVHLQEKKSLEAVCNASKYIGDLKVL